MKNTNTYISLVLTLCITCCITACNDDAQPVLVVEDDGNTLDATPVDDSLTREPSAATTKMIAIQTVDMNDRLILDRRTQPSSYIYYGSVTNDSIPTVDLEATDTLESKNNQVATFRADREFSLIHIQPANRSNSSSLRMTSAGELLFRTQSPMTMNIERHGFQSGTVYAKAMPSSHSKIASDAQPFELMSMYGEPRGRSLYNALLVNPNDNASEPINILQNRKIEKTAFFQSSDSLLFTTRVDGDTRIIRRTVNGDETDITPFEGARMRGVNEAYGVYLVSDADNMKTAYDIASGEALISCNSCRMQNVENGLFIADDVSIQYFDYETRQAHTLYQFTDDTDEAHLPRQAFITELPERHELVFALSTLPEESIENYRRSSSTLYAHNYQSGKTRVVGNSQTQAHVSTILDGSVIYTEHVAGIGYDQGQYLTLGASYDCTEEPGCRFRETQIIGIDATTGETRTIHSAPNPIAVVMFDQHSGRIVAQGDEAYIVDTRTEQVTRFARKVTVVGSQPSPFRIFGAVAPQNFVVLSSQVTAGTNNIHVFSQDMLSELDPTAQQALPVIAEVQGQPVHVEVLDVADLTARAQAPAEDTTPAPVPEEEINNEDEDDATDDTGVEDTSDSEDATPADTDINPSSFTNPAVPSPHGVTVDEIPGGHNDFIDLSLLPQTPVDIRSITP